MPGYDPVMAASLAPGRRRGKNITNATLPQNLTWSVSSKRRWVNLRPYDYFTDDFYTSGISTVVLAGTAAVTAQHGVLTMTSSAAGDRALIYPDVELKVPMFTMWIDIDSYSGDATEERYYLGLWQSVVSVDSTPYIRGQYNHSSGYFVVDQFIGGTTTTLVNVQISGLAPKRILVTFEGNNTITIWYDEGNGPVFVGSGQQTAFELRDPAVLATLTPALRLVTDSGSMVLSGYGLSEIGGMGMRDQCIVTYANGEPYIRDGWLYFTATLPLPSSPGSGGNFVFETQHAGVFRYNLGSGEIEQTGALWFNRDSSGTTLVMNDYAMHLVIDEHAGMFRFVTTSWADSYTNSSRILYGTSYANVLHGSHVLDAAFLTNLPSTNGHYEDASMVLKNGIWYVAYIDIITPGGADYYPTLASTTDFSAFTQVWQVTTYTEPVEGARIQRVGGVDYVMYGGATTHPLFAFADGSLVGVLAYPFNTAYKPHPALAAVPSQAGSRYVILTFDGDEGAWAADGYMTGNHYVLEAAETVDGFEYPRELLG